MSFESPKKDADCFQSPLIASSTARIVAWYSAWFEVISGVVVVVFKITTPDPPW